MARGGRLAVGPGPRVGVARLGNWFHHMVESHTMLHRRRETAAGRAGDPLPSLADAGLDLRRPVRERRDHAHPCRSEEHTSELQSHSDLVCRLLLEKKKKNIDLRVRVKKKTKKQQN